jgi:hypothetical protein
MEKKKSSTEGTDGADGAKGVAAMDDVKKKRSCDRVALIGRAWM